ncbi:hypothetical protein [Thermococcus sp. Bubb.Bath]|uniref:hypothetical protein n=1 Tax=Thermococcus sp. Bubb.Bath TaxID=1638242 RepID=UPI00143B18C3|nr:hypothetical protein [Thermococcus sp. Bubb.Bath]NJF25777.1 hypothetical protein [Thermococcus sp. Bubb.Bath]
MRRGDVLIGLFLVAAVGVTLTGEAYTAGTRVINAGGISFSAMNMLVFILFSLVTIALFARHLGTKGYAWAFYLIAVSTVAVWLDNTPPLIDKSSLNVLNGYINSLLPWEVHISPEGAFYAYVYLLLLLVTAVFYTAPRRAREMGFLTFGLLFSMPVFRAFLYPPSFDMVGITAFAISLALASTLVFSPNPIIAAFQTIVLSATSVVAIAVQPWTAVMPFAFAFSFPRKKRNLAYVAMVVLGILGLLHFHLFIHPPAVEYSDRSVLLQVLLPLGVVIYAPLTGTGKEIRILKTRKGTTPFFLANTTILGLVALERPEVLPYAIICLVVLAVRSIYILGKDEKGIKI